MEWLRYQCKTDFSPLQQLNKNQIMRAHRLKSDWSKPFKLVNSKAVFDQIDATEDIILDQANQEEVITSSQNNKFNIIVPPIQEKQRIISVKSHASITPNYIRIHPHLNLPQPNTYELTHVDISFLTSLQNKFTFNAKNVLTPQFLTQAIIYLEMKAGKQLTLPKNKGWMMTFIQKQHKDLFNMANCEQFAETVYNYWKNRRQELKFPLFRPLWRPNQDQYYYLLAFKIREKQKRNLRKGNRIVEEDIILDLEQEFDVCEKVTNRVKMREDHKFKQVQVQISAFYNECKSFLNGPFELDCQVNAEVRLNDRQKLKEMHKQIEQYRVKKQNTVNQMVIEEPQEILDQKLTIAQFLSTVVVEAENLKISYQKIFTQNYSNLKEKEYEKKDQKNMKETQLIGGSKEEENTETSFNSLNNQKQNHPNTLNISIRRIEDLIVRTFDQETEVQFHHKKANNYLDYKRNQISDFYFGSDDEGEFKDLKKNISTSFKRFQQMSGSSGNIEKAAMK